MNLRLLRAEWTKFTSVPGWVRGSAAAALLIVLFPLAGLGGGGGPAQPIPAGPGGVPVSAAFYLVHRPLSGDGRITVAVTALTSVSAQDSGATNPWAKAGLIITAGREPGARYAAIMLTGGHGVRMQHDYIHDQPADNQPASSGAAVRWLRLIRSGDLITGETSADGTQWSRAGTVRLPGLAATVAAGLFVACPQSVQGIGTAGDAATAGFGVPQLAGGWPATAWSGDQIGARTATFAGYPPGSSGGFTSSTGGFVVTGAGDLAPATRADVIPAATVNDLLFGTFPALIVIVVVATLMITTEFRYGLIRGTLSASPRRGRVLLAKAAVLAGVTFTTSLAATALAVPLWSRVVRSLGVYLFPATPGALLRAEVGTAAMLAAVAVFALAAGTVLRRSATAVTTVIAVTVLPYLLALTPFLPPPMTQWLTRVTPAAALSVQQTLIRYPQVDSVYTPANGYYPLPPWAGLAVLGGYAAVAFAVAVVVLRRRDA
jgi:hypothetical protein